MKIIGGLSSEATARGGLVHGIGGRIGPAVGEVEPSLVMPTETQFIEAAETIPLPTLITLVFHGDPATELELQLEVNDGAGSLDVGQNPYTLTGTKAFIESELATPRYYESNSAGTSALFARIRRSGQEAWADEKSVEITAE